MSREDADVVHISRPMRQSASLVKSRLFCLICSDRGGHIGNWTQAGGICLAVHAVQDVLARSYKITHDDDDDDKSSRAASCSLSAVGYR